MQQLKLKADAENSKYSTEKSFFGGQNELKKSQENCRK